MKIVTHLLRTDGGPTACGCAIFRPNVVVRTEYDTDGQMSRGKGVMVDQIDLVDCGRCKRTQFFRMAVTCEA